MSESPEQQGERVEEQTFLITFTYNLTSRADNAAYTLRTG